MQNCDLTHSGIILSQSPGIGGLFTKVRTATLEWDKILCGDATNCSYCWTAGKPTARPPDLNQLFKEHFPASLGPETKLFSCTSSQVGRILHSAGCQGINPNSAIHTALVSWTAKWVTDSLREEFCNPSKKKKSSVGYEHLPSDAGNLEPWKNPIDCLVPGRGNTLIEH